MSEAARTSGQEDQPDRADLRLLPIVVSMWGSALAGLAFPGQVTLSAAAVAAATGTLLLVRQGRAGRGRPLTPVAALLICAAVAAGVASARASAVRGGPLADLARSRAVGAAELVLTADPARSASAATGFRADQPSIAARARLEGLVARGTRVTLRRPILVLATDDRWLGLLPGQRVVVTGRLAPARDGESVSALLLVRGPPRLVRSAGRAQRIAGDLRTGLRRAVAGLRAPERGLVPGLVLGDTSGLNRDLEADFRAAGLSHLLAVSGANLAIVLGFVMFAGRWAGVRGWGRPLVGVATVAAFVVVARPQPSVLRAAVMGLIAVGALWRGRKRSGFAAVLAAAGSLILIDPWLARSYGFALSVLATTGLVLFAGPWGDRMQRWLPGALAHAVAVPAAATLSCAPVVVMLAGEISLVAIPANLLVTPAVAPATVLGVLAAAVSPFSDVLARVLGELAGLPAWWIVMVARHAAGLPHSTLPWASGLTGAVALGCCLLAAVITYRWLRRRRVIAIAAIGAVIGLLAARAVVPGWPPRDWVLVACDVGQGDAMVLNAGDGAALVVDAGPDPRSVDRCLRGLGVRQIPLLLLTHLHADHVEGVPGILRHRQIGRIATGPLAEPALEAVRTTGWAAGAGLRLERTEIGVDRVVGRIRWRAIWPTRVIPGPESVPNNASVVVIAEVSGIRLLLTGDIEPSAQRAVLASGADLAADVLKVPHHGSAHQAQEFLTAAGARIAIVSAGAGNDYGHPSSRTLRALEEGGALVVRTDRHGTVALAGAAGQLRIVRQPR